jgi:hypothetical protein
MGDSPYSPQCCVRISRHTALLFDRQFAIGAIHQADGDATLAGGLAHPAEAPHRHWGQVHDVLRGRAAFKFLQIGHRAYLNPAANFEIPTSQGYKMATQDSKFDLIISAGLPEDELFACLWGAPDGHIHYRQKPGALKPYEEYAKMLGRNPTCIAVVGTSFSGFSELRERVSSFAYAATLVLHDCAIPGVARSMRTMLEASHPELAYTEWVLDHRKPGAPAKYSHFMRGITLDSRDGNMQDSFGRLVRGDIKLEAILARGSSADKFDREAASTLIDHVGRTIPFGNTGQHTAYIIVGNSVGRASSVCVAKAASRYDYDIRVGVMAEYESKADETRLTFHASDPENAGLTTICKGRAGEDFYTRTRTIPGQLILNKPTLEECLAIRGGTE